MDGAPARPHEPHDPTRPLRRRASGYGHAHAHDEPAHPHQPAYGTEQQDHDDEPLPSGLGDDNAPLRGPADSPGRAPVRPAPSSAHRDSSTPGRPPPRASYGHSYAPTTSAHGGPAARAEPAYTPPVASFDPASFSATSFPALAHTSPTRAPPPHRLARPQPTHSHSHTHPAPPAIRIPPNPYPSLRAQQTSGPASASSSAYPAYAHPHPHAHAHHHPLLQLQLQPQPPLLVSPYDDARYPPSPYAPSPSYLYPSAGSSSHSHAHALASIDERGIRSPHPPLTAIYQGHAWPPSFPRAEPDYFAAPPALAHPHSHPPAQPRAYLSSPISDSHSHRTFVPAYLPALPPPPHLASPTAHSGARSSPLLPIPPPLRFKYSTSPPPPPLMPSRRKPAGSTGTVPNAGAGTAASTPHSAVSLSSAGAGPGRKNGWTTEHTYDSVGQPKEVIVIQDSESPAPGAPPKKRTRAQVAAAAAAALNGNGNGHALGYAHAYGSAGTSASASSVVKKRKVDEESDAGSIKKGKAKPSTSAHVPPPPPKPAAPLTHPLHAGPPTWDDSEGHYIVKPDDVIGGRYKIVRLLGQGTFGKVVEAKHIESRRKVAIKIIRAVQKYRDASKIEIRVLEALKKHDPTNQNKCIHLTEHFDFRNHPCLVSELYGMSVFDFLKLNHFQPFPEKHIQDFARSLLSSVAFLHSLKLVHTDLKPENILLVGNEARLQGPRRANARSKQILRNTDIRLIDFGSATFENEYHSSVVSTRHYRAPEIILGLSWSYPCDMFSIGCILVEFFTGDALFQTHDNLEHLAMMEVVMGKMPPRMVDKGRLKKPEFFKGNKIDFPNPSVSKSSRKFVKGLKSLKDIIPPTNQANALFLDLIVRLLEFDPDARLNVHDALKHPYFRTAIPEPA
ncbi:serine threonine protein kinase CMGC group [Cryptotrichosporon argae]